MFLDLQVFQEKLEIQVVYEPDKTAGWFCCFFIQGFECLKGFVGFYDWPTGILL